MCSQLVNTYMFLVACRAVTAVGVHFPFLLYFMYDKTWNVFPSVSGSHLSFHVCVVAIGVACFN